MNREQKRALKKAKPQNQGIVFQHRMNIGQVQIFLEPLESFIEQVRADSVYFDTQGNPLMDLPNTRVEDMARKGLEPRRAFDNINAILETYFQVTALCYSNDDLLRVNDQIEGFKRKILNAMRMGTPVQIKSVEEAEEMCKDYRVLLMKSPAYQVQKVADNIRNVIVTAHNKNQGKVMQSEMRAWLVDEMEKRVAAT